MADLTGINPNVMYELGLRHTFKRPLMIVKQKGCEIPFDVNDYIVHEYENTPTGLKYFKKLVREVVEDLENYPEKPDNPVWDMIYYGGFMLDHYNRIENLNKLKALKIELNINNEMIEEIIKEIEKPKTTITLCEMGITLISIQLDSISLLSSTCHVNFDSNEWYQIRKLSYLSNYIIRGGLPLIPCVSTIVDKESPIVKCIIRYNNQIKKVIEIINKRIDGMASISSYAPLL